MVEGNKDGRKSFEVEFDADVNCETMDLDGDMTPKAHGGNV